MVNIMEFQANYARLTKIWKNRVSKATSSFKKDVILHEDKLSQCTTLVETKHCFYFDVASFVNPIWGNRAADVNYVTLLFPEKISLSSQREILKVTVIVYETGLAKAVKKESLLGIQIFRDLKRRIKTIN